MQRFILSGIFLLGCVPVPYVSLPAKVQFTSSPVESQPVTPDGVEVNRFPVHVSIALSPLGIFPNLRHRKWDIDAGVMLHQDDALGGVIGLEVWPWSSENIRFGFTSQQGILVHSRYLTSPTGRFFRSTAGVGIEIVTDSNDITLPGPGLGYSHGESGFGFDISYANEKYPNFSNH